MVLRFVSSLVLSRLLFPEAFGLAVTVGLVSAGLIMISNVGITQSIIQSPNGDKSEYLNTGWTVSAIRGVVLWLAAVVLAYPVASLLNEPQLIALLPVGCLGVLVAGFASTSLITLRRNLNVRPILALEVYSQILTFALNVLLAWWFESVWGLIVASLVGNLFSTIGSHFLKVGYRNRFQWHAPSWQEMYRYGRWIQASSAMSFTSTQADRLLLAHYIGMSSLGVYNFASMLAEAISSAVIRITHGVLFPLFSQISRDEPAELTRRYYKIRLRTDALTLLPLGCIAASSQLIVDIMFDDRYAAAGWMLEALCVRAAMTCLLAPVETYLFSIGQTRYGFYRDIARALWVLPGIPLAWMYGGLPAVVWTVALSEVPVVLVLWPAFSRHAKMLWLREAIGPVAFVVGYLFCAGVWRLIPI
jgi:O-antigen/teichoic acid export membrane protein